FALEVENATLNGRIVGRQTEAQVRWVFEVASPGEGKAIGLDHDMTNLKGTSRQVRSARDILFCQREGESTQGVGVGTDGNGLHFTRDEMIIDLGAGQRFVVRPDNATAVGHRVLSVLQARFRGLLRTRRRCIWTCSICDLAYGR